MSVCQSARDMINDLLDQRSTRQLIRSAHTTVIYRSQALFSDYFNSLSTLDVRQHRTSKHWFGRHRTELIAIFSSRYPYHPNQPTDFTEEAMDALVCTRCHFSHEFLLVTPCCSSRFCQSCLTTTGRCFKVQSIPSTFAHVQRDVASPPCLSGRSCRLYMYYALLISDLQLRSSSCSPSSSLQTI